MRATIRRLLGLGTVSLALLAAPGCGGEGSSEPALQDWARPNADLSNTRHVSGPIDSRSVGRLRRAWAIRLLALSAATPVVVDGIAYTADLMSNVYAIDAASGRPKWLRAYQQMDTGPNGVNVVDGRVYGVLPRSAIALDARTGRELWSTRLVRDDSETVVMTPGEHRGTVYVSTAPATAGAIGTLWALDGATGRRLWSWEQVPRSLWGHPEINGGGGMWHPPAFDERGDLYLPIANPIPFPGVEGWSWGSSRPGPNRWNNSIVKLEGHTGRFLWGNQVLPHDIYDWDLQCPVILVSANGRDLAITAGKMGYVYAFDADDGELVWKRSVGVHNGHDDDNLRTLRREPPTLRLGEKLYPGGWGGVQTQLASDGEAVFVPINNLPAIYRTMRFAPPDQPNPIEGTGQFVALDVATGRVKWDRRLPHSSYGAATVVNDLVFTTTYDGTVWALRTDDGETAWSGRLRAGTDTPVTIAGDTLITAASLPIRAGDFLEIVAYRLK